MKALSDDLGTQALLRRSRFVLERDGLFNVQDLLVLSLQARRSALDGCSKLVGLGLPVSKVVLTVVEDLAGLRAVLEDSTGITWDDGRVVEEFQETTSVLGEEDLLLGTLNDSGKLCSVCLLEFLTSLDE